MNMTSAVNSPAPFADEKCSYYDVSITSRLTKNI